MKTRLLVLLVCLLACLVVAAPDAQVLRIFRVGSPSELLAPPPVPDTSAPGITITTISGMAATEPFDCGSTTPCTVAGTISGDDVASVVFSNDESGASNQSCTFSNDTDTFSCSVGLIESTDNDVVIVACDEIPNCAQDTNTLEYAPSGAMSCSHCTFETSFLVADGWNADKIQSGSNCGGSTWNSIETGVSEQSSNNGGDYAAFGTDACSYINTTANNPSGLGGRGHAKAETGGCATPGVNCSGMAVQYSFTATSEMWIRWYEKYEAGFQWGASGANNPGYAKHMRWGGTFGMIQDYLSGGVQCMAALWYSGCGTTSEVDRTYAHDFNSPSGCPVGNPPGKDTTCLTWNDIHNTDASGGADGNWVCFETYLNGGTGQLTMWINGTEVVNHTGPTFSGQATSVFSSNQSAVQSGQAFYHFYDDIAVSSTQRIGCF